jgi:hypothetical protein
MDYYVDGNHVAFDSTAANGFDEEVTLPIGSHSLVCRATFQDGSKADSPVRLFQAA